MNEEVRNQTKQNNFCKMGILVTDPRNSRSTTVTSRLVPLAKLTVGVRGHHRLPMHVSSTSLLGESLIHIFVWRRGAVGAFSFLSTPCPWLGSKLDLPRSSSPHHCSPRHRDDTQHVPRLRQREKPSFILWRTCHFPLSPGFLISPSRVFCRLMMHNIQALFERVEGCMHLTWGGNVTDRDMSCATSPRCVTG